MSERVLAGAGAREAITRMQCILMGPLLDQIGTIMRDGQTLSDANVWDGRMAQEFRSQWPNVHRRLTDTVAALEELRAQVSRVNQNIMAAGGNL